MALTENFLIRRDTMANSENCRNKERLILIRKIAVVKVMQTINGKHDHLHVVTKCIRL